MGDQLAFSPSLPLASSLRGHGARTSIRRSKLSGCGRRPRSTFRPCIPDTCVPIMSAAVGNSASPVAAQSSKLPERTLICTSLTADTVDGQLREMQAAKLAGADLAEIRVDLLAAEERNGWQRAVERKVLPVIVTNRACWEGGNAPAGESERLEVLLSAVAHGAEFIDVELAAIDDFRKLLGEQELPPTRLILSHHNFERSLSLDEVRGVYRKMVAADADICKVAMAASSARDNAVVFSALAAAEEKPMIMLAMGELGQCSRILAPKYGSFLTFASVGDGRESAPGQVATNVLTEMYRFQSMKPSTDVYGVIGNPVSHSMSPALHNAAFSDAEIDAVYVPLKVEDDVAMFIREMTPLGFSGFSVTIPGKVSALGAMDTVEDVTMKIGAMNTVVTQGDGTLRGYNTDWVAAISAIEDTLREDGKELTGARVLCIGAGGAARGLAFGALARGASHVVIANRTAEKAEILAREIGDGASAIGMGSLTPASSGPFDVIMNTTSVGMHPNVADSPLSGGKEVLEEFGTPLLFDAVYNPLETQLLKDGKAAKCLCVSGVEMFIRQAAEQFRLWFPSSEVNVALMRSVVMERLGAK